MSNTERVLLVDDEPNLLDGIRRQLRGKFAIEAAAGAERALEILRGGSRFSVVVSDMRMPSIDGAEFLSQVRRSYPDMVRVMLTGNADQDTAARAINQGHIFRFVTKPISIDDLTLTLNDSIAEFRVRAAERDLLQNTVTGSIKVLTDVLSMLDPATFGASLKLRERVRQVCKIMSLPDAWEIELASMLAQLGKVVLPGTVLEKLRNGNELSEQETRLVERAPEVGKSLISNIPRLQNVAAIVLYHSKHFDGRGFPANEVRGEEIPLGARILKLLTDISAHETEGKTLARAFAQVQVSKGSYDPALLQDMEKIVATLVAQETPTEPEPGPCSISWRELRPGHKLIEDVFTKSGVLLIHAGSTITDTVLERLKNYARLQGLKEPLRVDRKIPRELV